METQSGRSAVRRPRRVTALFAALTTVSALLTGVVLIAGSPTAVAGPAPPAENFLPSLTGGPAGQDCGVSVLCVGPAEAHTTIGAAIAAAPDGATIQVKRGTYNERLTISSKSLTILGGFPAGSWTFRDPGAHVTTINAQGGGTAISATGAFDGSGSLTLDGLRIINGKAQPDEFDVAQGSGVLANGVGTVTVSHNLIEDNGDALPFGEGESDGGGIAVTNATSATISSNIIRNNQSQRGGAVSADADTTVVRSNLVVGNDGWGDHGGALYLGGDQTTIEGNLVRNNRIGVQAGYGWGGGGIFFGPDTHATVRNNRWVGNQAPSYGSGFYVDEDATATIRNDLYARNGCGDRGGAGLAVDGGGNEPLSGSDVTLVNVTIADHDCPASYHGSGLYVEGGSRVVIRNSIITGNGGSEDVIVCTPQNEAAISCNMADTPPLGPSSVTYSLLGPRAGLTAGTGVTSGNPGFVSLANGNYQLAASSQAIDAGDPADPVEDEPPPNGGRRDLGAYGGTSEATSDGGGGEGATPAQPVLSGQPRVGNRLTMSRQQPPAGYQVAYRWLRGSKLISGANARTYRLVRKDRSKKVFGAVIWIASDGTSTYAISKPKRIK